MTMISLLPVLLTTAPLFFVWLAGIVLAVSNWNKNPRVSALVTIAMSLFLISGAGGLFLSLMPFYMNRLNMQPGQLGTFYVLVNLGRTVLSTAGWVLILIAIFGRHPVEAAVIPEYPHT